jgi:hypothetical protein
MNPSLKINMLPPRRPGSVAESSDKKNDTLNLLRTFIKNTRPVTFDPMKASFLQGRSNFLKILRKGSLVGN